MGILKKYISLDKLDLFYIKLKDEISSSNTATLSDAKSYVDEELSSFAGEMNEAIGLLDTAIEGKADSVHTHAISQIDGLQEELNSKDAKGSAESALSEAKSYTDTEVASALESANSHTNTKIAELINGAPTTLDTLGEIATAFAENKDVVEALNDAIGSKANKADLEALATNIVTKEDLDTEINKPKDYITLNDTGNGYTYILQMINGNLVSRCAISSIEVTKMPDKTEYVEGEYLDTTGMVVTATCYNGNTLEITDYAYTNEPLAVGENKIDISYTEYGMIYTTSIKVTTTGGFNPEVALIDFVYTDNGDGTYTITDWKGTKDGVASTEVVIPDDNRIVW